MMHIIFFVMLFVFWLGNVVPEGLLESLNATELVVCCLWKVVKISPAYSRGVVKIDYGCIWAYKCSNSFPS